MLEIRDVMLFYLNHSVPDADHVLGQILHQAEEAPLGVEPGVGAELLVVGLQGLDHAADAKLVIALSTVQYNTVQHITVQ